jgi:hypothetical protein
MLATRILPETFLHWNHKWHAPDGRFQRRLGALASTRWGRRLCGPFATQCNSSTRVFEYPWCHAEISARGRGLEIVEIGGGMSGLQFVLAREGHRVTNVDPGPEAKGGGWGLDESEHAQLCRAFKAPVRLIPTTIDRSGLGPASADVVVCISALEHFAPADVTALAEAVPMLLRPGGVLVMTVDLFLDLAPFTGREANRWGRNFDIRRFLEAAGLELVKGNRHELYGFEEFDSRTVLENLSSYLMGQTYPCLAQCFVAGVAGSVPRNGT